MARICAITGRRPVKGSIINRKGQSKKSGGIGTHVTSITKRKFRPNLQRIRIRTANGGTKSGFCGLPGMPCAADNTASPAKATSPSRHARASAMTPCALACASDTQSHRKAAWRNSSGAETGRRRGMVMLAAVQ